MSVVVVISSTFSDAGSVVDRTKYPKASSNFASDSEEKSRSHGTLFIEVKDGTKLLSILHVAKPTGLPKTKYQGEYDEFKSLTVIEIYPCCIY